MALDWQFTGSLAARQNELIQRLKPTVTAWGTDMYPKLLKQRRKARSAEGDGSEASSATSQFDCHGVWVFVAMIMNDDIGTDMIAMVGASRQESDIMRDAFLESVHLRMGAPTSEYEV
jgi:hypothetical protein